MNQPSEEHSAIAELLRHNLWANLRLLDSCVALPELQLAETVPGTYGTVYDTLLHFARSEEWYLSDLTGIPRPMPFEDGGRPNLAEIKAHLRLSGEGLAK